MAQDQSVRQATPVQQVRKEILVYLVEPAQQVRPALRARLAPLDLWVSEEVPVHQDCPGQEVLVDQMVPTVLVGHLAVREHEV